MQESDRWCRKVVAGAGLVAARAELVFVGQEGDSCCRKVVAGAGLVVAAVGKWSPVQDW